MTGKATITKEELEALPIGAGVVDDHGDLYQRRDDGLWYGALIGGDNDETDESLFAYAPLTVVHLPVGTEGN